MAHLEFLRDTALPFSLRQLDRLRETLRRYSRQGEEQTRRAQQDLFNAENNLKRTRGQYAGLQDESLMARNASRKMLFAVK